MAAALHEQAQIEWQKKMHAASKKVDRLNRYLYHVNVFLKAEFKIRKQAERDRNILVSIL